MNHRKFTFVALAIGLPVALIVPLRAARSWQPRILELELKNKGAGTFSDASDLRWDKQGIFLLRRDSASSPLPLEISAWNGVRWPVKVWRAERTEFAQGSDALAVLRDMGEPLNIELRDTPNNTLRSKATQRLGRTTSDKRSHYQATAMALSPNGERLAYNYFESGGVLMADARTGQRDVTIAVPLKNVAGAEDLFFVRALAFSPDNRELAIVGTEGVWIVDARTGRLQRRWRKPKSRMTRALWSPNGKYLAISWGYDGRWKFGWLGSPKAGANDFLWLHDAQTGSIIRSWSQVTTANNYKAGVTNTAFSPDGEQLAWGTHNGQTWMMNVASGQVRSSAQIESKMPPLDTAQFVAFSPDGDTLAVANQEKITLWRVR